MTVTLLLYLGFLMMGLPEALLGASWPAMGSGLNVAVPMVAWIAVIIAAFSMLAALTCEPLVRRWGTGLCVDFGVLLSVVGLLGFAYARAYWILLVFSLPYGFAAGMLATSLNAYVALRYSGAHINWMHATTAAGAMVGHTVLGWIIANGADWRGAYRWVGYVQLALAVVLLAGTKQWKDDLTCAQRARLGQVPYAQADFEQDVRKKNDWSFAWRRPRALAVLGVVLGFTGVEQTTMLWASSYMVHAGHMSVRNAGIYANLFFIGLTLGCVVAGLLASRISDGGRLSCGIAVIALALVVMLVPLPGIWRGLTAPVLLGFGCAPINPAVVHLTPRYFGASATHVMIGLETAVISVTTMVAPACFGLVQRWGSIHLLPWYLLVFAVFLAYCVRALLRDMPGDIRLRNRGERG